MINLSHYLQVKPMGGGGVLLDSSQLKDNAPCVGKMKNGVMVISSDVNR